MDDNKIGREELIGLHVKIKDCTDSSWKGKSGLIVDETKNTFLIKIDNKQKIIVKKTATFEFNIKGRQIILNGSKISYRPENRIKKVR
ncbi:MAG: ribonuclease P protein subunit [Thermoplasmatales archaeon]|nr:MAG: ribonuclease P protein subunit [Thermoplasmatales archaeon]